MRVWLIQIGEPVPLKLDIKRMRTALMADELSRRGHQVIWWASTFDHGSRSFVGKGGTSTRISENVEVRLLGSFGYRRNFSPRRYFDHWLVAFNFRRALKGVVTRPDIVVAATPDYHIAADAARFSSENRIPYVIDVRDQWPDSFLDYFSSPMARKMIRFFLAADFRKVVSMLKQADAVTGMMESMVDWGLGHAGRERGEADKVFFLGTEPIPEPDPVLLAKMREAIEWQEAAPTVVYVGTFGHYNHPEVLLQAVQLLHERGDAQPFNVILGGEGELFDQIYTQYQDLPGVQFMGWLNAEQISAVLSLGTIAVNPWTKGDAFPNKAFSYLAAGLPILTSATGDLRQIVEQEGIGAYFESGDVAGLADLLLMLLRDRDGLRSMSSRVQEIYPVRFEARKIYREFVDHLEAIAARRIEDRVG